MPQLDVGMVLWRRALGPFVVTVTYDEYTLSECEQCCSIALDFPWGERNNIPCPHTACMNNFQYANNLMRRVSQPLNALRSEVGAPEDDALVQDLFVYAMNFSMNHHYCVLNGSGVVPVASISVTTLEGAEAQFLQESTPVSVVKRATRESVEALPAASADELEADSSCVICVEELKDDHKLDRIAIMPCRHVFHRDCIAGWLNNSHVCPLCRFELPAEQVLIAANQQTLTP